MASNTARRQCVHTIKSTGERCKQAPMKGQTECWKHGGGAPQKMLAAKLRLLSLVEPSLEALARVINDRQALDADKIRAAFGVLDRVGIGPEQVLKVMAQEDDPWADAMRTFLEKMEASNGDGSARSKRGLGSRKQLPRKGRGRVIKGELADE
jgi:hypothetical protein